MRHISCFFLAAVSLAILLRAQTTTRPRYGGVLRVETAFPIRALDPAAGPDDCPPCSRLTGLVFDRLVQLDETGVVKPALAVSWRHDLTGERWHFRLRPWVKFHDGSPLTAASAAAALNAISRGLRFSSSVDGELVVEAPPSTRVDLELAEPPNYVFVRGADKTFSGTGAYRVVPAQAPRRVHLQANEEHWAGRPFLDSITVETGRPWREQLLDLELGRADVVDLLPADERRVSERGGIVWTSGPSVLLALRLDTTRPALERAALREALALSIDRDAIYRVLLQKHGEPAGALLPQWLSGYAFLFPSAYAPARARQLLAPGNASQPLALTVDPADGLARLVADRIAVNAREVGLTLRVTAGGSGTADIEMVRIPITSSRPAAALGAIAAALRLSFTPVDTPPGLYEQERTLLADFRVVPLFHVPVISASAARVRTWATPGVGRLGEWHFEDVWLDQGAQ